MEAVFSGQAGAAAVIGRTPQLRPVNAPPVPDVTPYMLGRILSDYSDLQVVSVSSAVELDALALRAWQADRALRIFLMFLGNEEPLDDLQECAECAEELFATRDAELWVKQNLFAASLPSSVDIEASIRLAGPYPKLSALLGDIKGHQSIIRRVRDAFDSISTVQFGGERAKSLFLELAISNGAFVDLVNALKRGESVDFVVLNLLAHMRHVENARDIVSKWTAEMRRHRVPAPSISATEVDEFAFFDEHSQSAVQGRKAFENVRLQQQAIIERLKARDIDGARRYVVDLLRTQAQNSSPEQAAKSLSRLSQAAKLHGVPELQLEWAEQAVEANSMDPRTHGHLADALILAGRYTEASAALDQSELYGDRLFSETGRARILRLTGRLSDSREKYLAAAAAFPMDRHALAGAAEILRDMGQHDEALAEYTKLTNYDPLQSHFWTGRASVLMDLGRFDEAISFFGTAAKYSNDAVPKNGRATAYKLAGDFSKALQLYDEVLTEFPNDAVGLSGRAEVFRAQGDLEKALEAYELAINRSPFVPVPISGKAEVLKELGRYADATTLLGEAVDRFPHEQSIAGGYAGVLKAQGRYVEALAAYDEVVRKFPFSLTAKLARIDVLKRMGNLDDALAHSDELIKQRPKFLPAQVSKASILILQGKWEEAEKLLPKQQPKSQPEWSRFFLRACFLEQQGDESASREMLRAGTRCPFARISQLFTAALARRELEAGRAWAAFEFVKAVEEHAPGVSNVIHLHALLANGRRQPAQDLYSSLASSEAARPYEELSSEIARHFRLVSDKPRHPRSWIFKTEAQALILEAA